MYTIRLIGPDTKQEFEVKNHIVDENDSGYVITDNLSIFIDKNMILTDIELCKDGVVIGYRQLQHPLPVRTDDELSIEWLFSLVDRRKKTRGEKT